MQAASEPTPQLLQQQRSSKLFLWKHIAYILQLLSHEKQYIIEELDIHLQCLSLDICSDDETLTNAQHRPILPQIDSSKPRSLHSRTHHILLSYTYIVNEYLR
jgi:hypothetical protein